MKIDQELVGLSIMAFHLACGYVVLFVISIPIFQDIYEGRNIGILLTVLSLAVVGLLVGKYFKTRCERNVYLNHRRINCGSEGTAAFMLFMFFSAIMLAAVFEYIK
jgi:hypothetical protein